MNMIKKEDWVNAKAQFENLLVNTLCSAEFHKATIKVCDDKIAEFPEEKIKKIEDEQIKKEIKKDLE